MTVRPTTRAQRAIIEDMAYFLVSDVADLGNDRNCIMVLVGRGFRGSDIFDHLDAARDLARAARTTEADLWDKLMGERT